MGHRLLSASCRDSRARKRGRLAVWMGEHDH